MKIFAILERLEAVFSVILFVVVIYMVIIYFRCACAEFAENLLPGGKLTTYFDLWGSLFLFNI